ncbi:MAG: hypothetical protein JWO38_4932 [Gemmataceae bacterium]|nr:hypothetical protein [Gemmataceae bacterium]
MSVLLPIGHPYFWHFVCFTQARIIVTRAEPLIRPGSQTHTTEPLECHFRPVPPTRRFAVAGILVAHAVLGSVGSACADFVATSTVNIAGTQAASGPGYFTGKIEVDNISTTQAAIRITLSNTSPISNGGYITGFAFNLPGTITTASLTSTYIPVAGQSFSLLGGPNFNNSITNYDQIKGSPYGYFDIGAAVGSSLLGTGKVQAGLAVNQTGQFTFSLNSTSYNLDNISAQLLMDTLSSNPQGGGSAPFLVRFRGFLDGSSDKVVGGVVCPSPPPVNGVPAPPGMLLGLLGFGGCLLGRGFRRRSAAATAG